MKMGRIKYFNFRMCLPDISHQQVQYSLRKCLFSLRGVFFVVIEGLSEKG